jgi:hypothetical protein
VLIIVGIVKRFIDALKGESFMQEVFPSFVEAFRTLVESSLSAEIFRSLALFITYALHRPSASASRTPMSRQGTTSARLSMISVKSRTPTLITSLDDKQGTNPSLTKQQVGAKILEMYADLLCEKNSTANLKKFARTVTNKVCNQSTT